jgi:hypothetical protein
MTTPSLIDRLIAQRGTTDTGTPWPVYVPVSARDEELTYRELVRQVATWRVEQYGLEARVIHGQRRGHWLVTLSPPLAVGWSPMTGDAPDAVDMTGIIWMLDTRWFI